MTFHLRKVGGPHTAGDCGGMSVLVNKFGAVEGDNRARPKVGYAIRVGSLYARTYQFQDWWQTSLITNILEEKDDYVMFQTLNSVYEWFER